MCDPVLIVAPVSRELTIPRAVGRHFRAVALLRAGSWSTTRQHQRTHSSVLH